MTSRDFSTEVINLVDIRVARQTGFFMNNKNAENGVYFFYVALCR